MTLPSSGILTSADINQELRESAGASLTIPDARTRWLTDRVSPNAIVAPSHFYGKTAVKLEATVQTGFGSSHSQTMAFGPAFTGRRIAVMVLYYFENQAGVGANPITNLSIQGSNRTSSGSSAGNSLADGRLAGAGLYWGNPTGTSGNVSVTFTNTARARIMTFSIAGVTSRTDIEGFNNLTYASRDPITIASNGVLLGGAMRVVNNNMGWTNITERGNFTASPGGASFRGEWAFNNRLPSGNRTISLSNFSNAPAAGCVLMSFE